MKTRLAEWTNRLYQPRLPKLVYSAIAQLVEQLTVNQLVAGSSPACGAILSLNVWTNDLALRLRHVFQNSFPVF